MGQSRDRPPRELVRHLLHMIEAGVDADVLEAFPATLWLEAKDVPRLQGTAHASSHLDLG